MYPLWAMTMSVGGTGPTVASIDPPVAATTGGGGLMTIIGANFTGATAVSLGGTAVTSFTVVNSTTITCRPAARAAGTGLNVSVTTPSGTNTTNALVRYLSPTQVTNVSAFLHSNLGITNGTGALVAAWLDQSSNARNFTQATGANQPTQVASTFGTMPSIQNASSKWLALGSKVFMTSGISAFAVIQQDSTNTNTTPVGDPGNSPYTIVGDSVGAYASFGLNNGQISCTHYGPPNTPIVRGSGFNNNTPQFIGTTFDTTVNVKAYSGATQQGTTATDANGLSANTGYNSIGAGYGPNDFYIGHLGMIVIVSGVISSSDLTDIYQYARQQFGVP